MLHRIILVLISLSLIACSGPQRKPQEQAIYQTLVEDLTFRKLADHCNSVSKATEQHVWRAEKEWRQRNDVFVEAADFGFAYNMINLTGDRQETGARYAMGLSFDVVHDAEQKAQDIIKSGLSHDDCFDLMAEYKDGKKDFSENKERYAMLLNLLQEKKRSGEDTLLKQAQLEVKKGRSYSRSSITAQKMAARSICPGAKILTLKSKWPLEIFEASCPDKSYVLIECKWGNCQPR